MYTNAQSVFSNIEEIRILIENYKPAILLLSEARLAEDMDNKLVKVDGYDILRCDSHSRHTDGLIVYVASEIGTVNISSYNKHLSWFFKEFFPCCQRNEKSILKEYRNVLFLSDRNSPIFSGSIPGVYRRNKNGILADFICMKR